MWNLIKTDNQYIQNLPPDEIDTLAILCELRLRIAIRLYEKQIQSLTVQEFDFLMKESEEMFHQPISLGTLNPRLNMRYQIPLEYQSGIFMHHMANYTGSQKVFESISKSANLIGWIRVEEAAYSWLATLFYKMGDHEMCSKNLSKINAIYLPKRTIIKEKLYSSIID